MRSAEREHLLPLWEPAAATSAVTTPEESTPSMILISVPYALQSGLRAVARCVHQQQRLFWGGMLLCAHGGATYKMVWAKLICASTVVV